ncbi:MAG: DUF4175 family protein, partial [Rhodothermales bacterium]|nr:DUF4175 family protein [Rhodothermales bacterium]
LAVPVLRLAGVLRRPSAEEVAERVEAAVPSAKDRLVAFLHLSSGRHSNSPQELVEEALHSLYEPFSRDRFDPVEPFDGLRRGLKYGAIPLILLATFVIAAPGPFGQASNRLLRAGTDFVRPAPFSLVVSPGDAEVLRGDSLLVRVRVVGTSQAEAPKLEVHRDGERADFVNAQASGSEAEFVAVEKNIRRGFRYRAVAGSVSSPWFDVTTVDRPIVRQLSVTVTNPRYSRLGTVRLPPNVGDVTALPGSRVRLEVMTGGGQATEGSIVFGDGREEPLALEGGSAAGEFTLRKTDTYRIRLSSANGITNEEAIEYRLDLLEDGLPSVTISSPEAVTELVEPFSVIVDSRIVDDFGFSRLSLMHRLAESRFGVAEDTFIEVPIELEDPRDLDQTVVHQWHVGGRAKDPVPGDVIEYYVRVWDNDSFSGFKPADSRLQRLVMPSLADRYRDLNEATDESAEQLEDFLETSEEIRDRFRELRNELQQKPESDWDDQRQLEQIQSMQESLEQSIESVSQGLQDLADEMQDNSLVSDETFEMFEQLKKAIDEINSPELMEALQKLRESMQNLDLQQMQQSMNDFEFSEEQFKERLKRALDLFKRLQVEQGLEEAARRAEELAKIEEEIRKATSELSEQSSDPENREEEDSGNDQSPDEQSEAQTGEDADSQERSDEPTSDSEGQRG